MCRAAVNLEQTLVLVWRKQAAGVKPWRDGSGEDHTPNCGFSAESLRDRLTRDPNAHDLVESTLILNCLRRRERRRTSETVGRTNA